MFLQYTLHIEYCSVYDYPEGGSVVFSVKKYSSGNKMSINSPLFYVPTQTDIIMLGIKLKAAVFSISLKTKQHLCWIDSNLCTFVLLENLSSIYRRVTFVFDLHGRVLCHGRE